MSVNIRYIVDDVDQAILFYENLGFEVKMHLAPGFAILSKGELQLLLNAPGAGGAGAAGGSPAPGGWNRFQIQVNDLGFEIARLRERSVTFRGKPVEGKGGRQILVEDPSGNPVELFESYE